MIVCIIYILIFSSKQTRSQANFFPSWLVVGHFTRTFFCFSFYFRSKSLNHRVKRFIYLLFTLGYNLMDVKNRVQNDDFLRCVWCECSRFMQENPILNWFLHQFLFASHIAKSTM